MRRQNPPQASLEQARALERLLKPAATATIYAVFAAVSFAFVALLFGVLAYDALLTPDATTVATFALMALLPSVAAVLAFRCRPSDPLSIVIRGLAKPRRHPIQVASFPVAFKVLLKTGEALCVNLWFYYPAKNHAADLKERLIANVRMALEQECTMRVELPSDREIEDVADRTLEALAAEYNHPVLYSEVRDMRKIRDSYSRLDDLTPSEYLGTGTRG